MSDNPVHEIERLLRRIADILRNEGRTILQDFPITPPQFIALQWLLEKGDMTIGELSEKMYLAFSTTTDLMDRMERNQLVERVRDQADRRVVRIHLLDKGKEIIKEVLEARRQYLQGILQHFTPEEIEELKRSLERLYNQMKPPS